MKMCLHFVFAHLINQRITPQLKHNLFAFLHMQLKFLLSKIDIFSSPVLVQSKIFEP